MRILSKIQTLILVLTLIVCIPVSSWAADGQRKLTQPVPPATFPIVINQSGSYVLTSNLVVTDPNLNAIEITVNDVTLDLNGHKIQGPNTSPPISGSGSGIYALNRYSISIKNGRVWGFGNYGIYLYSTPGDPSEKGAGHIIDSIQTANNGNGVVIRAGLVINCTTNNNQGDGLTAYDSTIANSVSHNNAGRGFYLDGCILNRCTANYNGSAGILTYERCRIEGNNLRNNGTYGLYLNGTKNYAVQNVGSLNTSGNFYDAHSGTPGANHMPIIGDNANYGF